MKGIDATNMLQLCTANFLYPWFSINLKWWSSSLRLHQVFPTSFFPNSTDPWSQLQKGRTILIMRTVYLILKMKMAFIFDRMRRKMYIS